MENRFDVGAIVIINCQDSSQHGKIAIVETYVWHDKEQVFYYYLRISNRRHSRRYSENQLNLAVAVDNAPIYKRRNPLLEALANGRSYQIGPLEGDLASMRAVLKQGQVLTISPVTNFHEIKAGDIVFVKWRGGNHILHLVKEVQDEQFLIINSLGKVNGWTHGTNILGKVTHIQEPA